MNDLLAKSWRQLDILKEDERQKEVARDEKIKKEAICPTATCKWRQFDENYFRCIVHGGEHVCGSKCEYIELTREGCSCKLTAASLQLLDFPNAYTARHQNTCDMFISRKETRRTNKIVRAHALRTKINETLTHMYLAIYEYCSSQCAPSAVFLDHYQKCAVIGKLYAHITGLCLQVEKLVNRLCVDSKSVTRSPGMATYITLALIYNSEIREGLPPLNILKRILPFFVPRKFTHALREVRARGVGVSFSPDALEDMRTVVAEMAL